MAKSKPKSQTAELKVARNLRPEIRDFVLRAKHICDSRPVSHFGMSRRLFDGQARALENLAAGKGANVLGFLRAKAELEKYEADPTYWPPEAEIRKPGKPKAKIAGPKSAQAVSA
jgi:hypothetical protein